MKKLILSLIATALCLGAFAQQQPNPFGPLPYQQLKDLVGQTFVPVTLGDFLGKPDSFSLKKEGDTTNLYDKDLAGKKLILISLDYDYQYSKVALLKDSSGTKYVSDIIGNNMLLPELILLTEMETAKKMFLGKTLWVNHEYLYVKTMGEDKKNNLHDIRFEPVTVVDIQPGNNEHRPLKFVLKTAQGQTGFLLVTLSGTNTDKTEKDNFFYNNFFTEDIRKKYKFDQNTWKYLKIYSAQKGMDMDAVVLASGYPEKMNNGPMLNQWVYPWGYIYFKDGKVTSIDFKN